METNNRKEPTKEYGSTAFLTGVSDEMHANMIESLLRAYDIPVLKKRKGVGGYLNILMGVNLYGVDIYVPTEKLALSRELIQNSELENEKKDEAGDIQEELEEERLSYQKKKLKRVWLIILIFYLPIVLWLLYRLAGFLIKLLKG